MGRPIVKKYGGVVAWGVSRGRGVRPQQAESAQALGFTISMFAYRLFTFFLPDTLFGLYLAGMRNEIMMTYDFFCSRLLRSRALNTRTV